MEKKKCSKCGKKKLLSEFSFKNKQKNILQSACKKCWIIIRKENYEKDKQKTIDRNKRTKKRNLIWFEKLKSNLKCNRCGEDHIATLQFHHIDPTKKEINVGVMINTYSIKTIKKEIEKCEVLCANCHTIHHYNERKLGD